MTADQVPDAICRQHWRVTFAVDDTDAMVQRATELGGAVEMPAMDFGEVRTAALRDPQGAGFLVEPVSAGLIRSRSEISTIRRSIDVEERVAASSP